MALNVSAIDAKQAGSLGGFVDLRSLPEELRNELKPLTGKNEVIRGAELDAVFAKLDVAASRTPASLRMLDALRAHVEENRARAEREGGRRFQGDADLDRVAAGGTPLSEGSKGDGVGLVQDALIDTGYAIGPQGANGVFDHDTEIALERFQRDAGIVVTGRIDQDTLAALAASAPPPGQAVERFAEWDRIWSDHRADVTIALDLKPGADSHDSERALMSGLRERGFRALSTSDIRSMSSDQRRELGLTDDRLDPSALYFVRSQDGDHAVVRLIAPDPTDDSGTNAKGSLSRAMKQDEVVIYAGSGAGANALDPAPKIEAAITGLGSRARRSNDQDSGRPAYQLMIFSGSSPELPGRSISDTDVIASTKAAADSTTGPRALGFLDAVLARSSNNTMIAEQSQLVSDHLRRMGFEGDTHLAAGTYGETGFLSNSGNRRIEEASGAKS